MATVDGVDVTPGDVVVIRLASIAGVDVWTLACIGTDETSDVDAINTSLVINTARKSATFIAPAPGKALMFRSTVNGALSATFGIFTLGSGNRVGALNETTEGNARFGWLAKFNRFLRGTVSGGGSVPSGTGFWHLTGGAGDSVAKLVEDGDIAPNAAIDGRKIVPTFHGPILFPYTANSTITIEPLRDDSQPLTIAGHDSIEGSPEDGGDVYVLGGGQAGEASPGRVRLGYRDLSSNTTVIAASFGDHGQSFVLGTPLRHQGKSLRRDIIASASTNSTTPNQRIRFIYPEPGSVTALTVHVVARLAPGTDFAAFELRRTFSNLVPGTAPTSVLDLGHSAGAGTLINPKLEIVPNSGIYLTVTPWTAAQIDWTIETNERIRC